MFLSVVIPTYRRPELLAKCLEGLQRQTLPSDLFEVLVVADGPDFRTSQYLNTGNCFAYRLRMLSLPAHRGPAAARNLGWQSADGDLIVFTDDDCIPAPHFLSAYFNYYCMNDGVSVALSGITFVPLSIEQKGRLTDFAINLKGLERASFITANCAVLKSDLMRVGGFDTDFLMAWREDSDLEFNLRNHGVQIDIQPCALVYHPLRKVRWGVCLNEQKKSMFNALLFKKYPQKYRTEVQHAPPLLYYCYALLTLLFFCSVLGLFPALGVILILLLWWTTFGSLFFKRWRPVGKNLDNAMELLSTTLVMPFYSIYWRIYGAIHFRVFFF